MAAQQKLDNWYAYFLLSSGIMTLGAAAFILSLATATRFNNMFLLIPIAVVIGGLLLAYLGFSRLSRRDKIIVDGVTLLLGIIGWSIISRALPIYFLSMFLILVSIPIPRRVPLHMLLMVIGGVFLSRFGSNIVSILGFAIAAIGFIMLGDHYRHRLQAANASP